MSNLFEAPLDTPEVNKDNLFAGTLEWPEIKSPPPPEPTMTERIGTDTISKAKELGSDAANFAQESSDYWKDQAAMAVGGADAAASMASGMVSMPMQGIAGLAGLVTGGPQKAEDWMKVAEEWTHYQPQTEKGKETLGLAQIPFEKLNEIAKEQGDKELEKYGTGPLGVAMATAKASAINLWPMIWEHLGGMKAAELGLDPMVERAAKFAAEDPNRASWARRSADHFKAEVEAQRFGGHPEDYLVDGKFVPKETPPEAGTVTPEPPVKPTPEPPVEQGPLRELEFQDPMERAQRVVDQRKMRDVGVDQFLADKIATARPSKPIALGAEEAPVVSEVPSVELNNTEELENLFSDSLDDFEWDEPVDETLFDDESTVDTVTPEVVEEVNKHRPKTAEKYASEEEVLGMEVHPEKFKTKKEAQARAEEIAKALGDIEPGEIQIIKIKNQWRMAMEVETAPIEEAQANIEQTVKELPELQLDSDLTAEDFADLEDSDARAKQAESELFKLIDGINKGLIEEPVSSESVVSDPINKDWETLLADEGMGVEGDQMESADPLDEALSWEEIDEGVDLVDQMYSDGIELNSGVPINGLKDIAESMRTEKGKIRETAKRLVQPSDAFSVERPFKRNNWNETGFAVKVQHELAGFFTQEGLRLSRKLSDLKFNKKELGELSLIRESKNRTGLSERQKVGVKILDEFYDTWTRRLKSVGGIQEKFPDSLIRRNLEMLEKLEAKIEAAKGEQRVKLMKKRAALSGQNRRLREMNYSPVMAEWFEEMYDLDPIKVGNIFSANPLKQRKTISYQDLLEAGLPIESLNAQDIMLNYVNRISKKYAILKIRQAAIRDGAMTSNVKRAQNMGYYPVDPMSMPLFKGLYGDGRLLQYLQEMSTGYTQGGLPRRILGRIKAFQFINPMYLGLNNIKQGAMLGSYSNLKLPIYLVKAFKSMHNWDADFYQAKMNGLSGNPMGETIRSWNAKALESTFPLAKRVMRMLVKNTLPGKVNAFGIKNFMGAGSLLNNFYEISYNAAWTFDTFTRMVSYHYLKDKGWSSKEAAQVAAAFHADYSSIPLKTRQLLTMGLFTPTYKIAEAKLYLDMMHGAAATITGKGKNAWFDTDSGPELKKSRKKAFIYARGLAYMLAIIYGFDRFMLKDGWDRDMLGVKYKRIVDTPEGQKELVFVENGAQNLLFKTLLRAYASVDNKDGEPFIKSLIKAFKYELHPALRVVVFDFAENRKGDGSYIYHVGDDPEIKMLKSAEYLAKQWVRALALLDPDEAQKETNKVLNEQFGKAMGLLMRSSVFTYIRARKEVRTAGRMKRLMKTIMSQAYSDKHGPSPEQLNNLQKMMRDLAEEAK